MKINQSEEQYNKETKKNIVAYREAKAKGLTDDDFTITKTGYKGSLMEKK